MTAFTLRRRKNMASVNLEFPKLNEYKHTVQLTPKESERYEALSTEAKGMLKDAKAKGRATRVKAYNHLLEIFLRMRQCRHHWQLCGERWASLLAPREQQKVVELTPEKNDLRDILQVQI